MLRNKVTALKRPHVDCLLLNAGMFPYATKVTADTQCEQTFAVNHLGHFYLAKLLTDDLSAPRVKMGAAAELWLSVATLTTALATKKVESRTTS